MKPTTPPPNLPERAPARPWLRIAAILDEQYHLPFQYECALTALPPKGWERVLEATKPHVILLGTTWAGMGEAWRGQYVRNKVPVTAVQGIAGWGKRNGVPVVFRSTEDSPHFDAFLGVARLADWVWTSDSNCVPRYQEALGHSRIGVWPFAAQPILHHPGRVPDFQRWPVGFFGSCKAHQYPQRGEQLEVLLSAARPFGLRIFCPYRYRGWNGADFAWPDKYDPLVMGGHSWLGCLTAQKEYRVLLNVQTVTDSPTMCSLRTAELAAMGVAQVSWDTPGARFLLGDDGAAFVRTTEEAVQALWRLLEHPEEREAMTARARDRILDAHTVSHRVDAMLEPLGITSGGVRRTTTAPRISVVCASKRPDRVAEVARQFLAQTETDSELFLLTHGYRWEPEGGLPERIRTLAFPETEPLATLWNTGCRLARAGRLTIWADDDEYAPTLLADHLRASDEHPGAVVGKRSHYLFLVDKGTLILRFPGQENEPARGVVTLSGAVIPKAVWHTTPFPVIRGSGTDSEWLKAVRRRGVAVWSCGAAGLMGGRCSGARGHTWQIDDSYFTSVERGRVVGEGLAFPDAQRIAFEGERKGG